MIWIKVLLSLLASLSVLLIFDARPIVRRFFTSSDRNSATILVKIIGAVLLLVSIILFYIVFNK